MPIATGPCVLLRVCGYTCHMSSPTASESAPVYPDWSVGDKLRKVRRDVLKIEQAEFAERLGVNRQRYAAWESGRTTPRDILALARRVELISRVPASWLLGLDVPARTEEGDFRVNRGCSGTAGGEVRPFGPARPTLVRVA